MSEDLGVLLDAIQGEGPSAEFVAQLRTRVLVEAATVEGPSDAVEIDVPGHHDATRRNTNHRAWTYLGLGAAAAALIVVGVIAVRGNTSDTELETVTAPEQSATDVPTQERPIATVSPATSAALVTVQDIFLEPGLYQLDNLGTDLAFTASEPTFIASYQSGSIELSPVGSPFVDDRRLTIMRLSALSNPAEPTKPLETLDDGWPAADFAGWLTDLAAAVAATDRADVVIDDNDAIRVNLQLDDITCASSADCAYLGTNWLLYTKPLNVGSTHRVWVIEQDDQSPVAVIASAASDDQQGWFDFADQLVSTMQLGDVEPHPVTVTPAGKVEHPMLGGIEIELERPSLIVETDLRFPHIPIDGESAGTTFLAKTFDHQGNVLQTADALTAYLRNGAELTELEPTRVDSFSARIFDIDRTDAQWVQLRSSPEAASGLHVPDTGRIWLIEHPSRGLLVVLAGASDHASETYTTVLAEATDLVRSLSFVDRD